MLNIDIFGVATGATGWTTHSLGFASALDSLAKVNFRTRRKVAIRQCLISERRAMFLRGLLRAPSEFGIVINGQAYPGQQAASWIVWETTVLPDQVRRQCEQTPFLWTPSSWGRQMLIENGIDAARISVVPEGVDTDFFHPAPQAEPRGRFRFLFVGKWEERKFVEGMVKAFAAEFSARDEVELVLHANNPYVTEFSSAAELQRLAVPSSCPIVLSRPGSAEDMRHLYQSADVFVCPTRAEGWGLPILEAMSCAVPAIVTRHSAPTDFMSDDVGYMLNVARMVDAKCAYFGDKPGQWAEPDIDHLRFLMRHAFENREEVRSKGLKAREEALRWTWMNSAKIALEAVRTTLA
jgi:glycosyltransferase involved in cell wall biosynthesis